MSFYNATCIGCGCSDERACRLIDVDTIRFESCTWLRIDRVAGVGVCSAPKCEPHIARWDKNDRMLQGQLSLGGAR